MNDPLIPFSIVPAIHGADSIVIDGNDLTKLLRAVEIAIVAGGPPRVILHAGLNVSADEIKGTGIVMLAPNDTEAVTQFLSNIDPELLAKEAFNRLDMSEGKPIQMALEVLKEWASGETSGPADIGRSESPV